MSAQRRVAGAIEAARSAACIWVIGYLIRGPQARPSVPRDLAAGALVTGALLALGRARRAWAAP